MRLLSAFANALMPEEKVRTWDWVCQHGRTENGLQFDPDLIPYTEGVFDAWDDPETREVVLEWGTRLGKSMTGMQIIQKVAATCPANGLLGTSTQELARRIVMTRLYKALRFCRKTAHLLPPKHRETETLIRLSSAPWYVAWSGSATQLADLSAEYGWANEIDKWTFNESQGGEAGEGDPLDQFMERFKEHWDYKVLFECSPSTKSKSRIDRKYQSSDKRQLHVPCPHCGRRQVLVFGLDEWKEGRIGGMRWEKGLDGRSDISVARKTAYYECCHCAGRIEDEQRHEMVKRGVWVPEGCSVRDNGQIVGQPLRDRRIAGFHLSSLYSLQLTWGQIAAEWIQKKASPESKRMFWNGWLALTWEAHPSKTTPDVFASRCGTTIGSGIVPQWATWLFAGVDQQEGHLVYVVTACGPDRRQHVVAYGVCETLEELEESVLRHRFVQDGTADTMDVALTLIDSGFRTEQTYRLCKLLRKEGILIQPCKGSNDDCGGEAYIRKKNGISESRTQRGKRALIKAGKDLERIRINPFYYESIIKEQIEDLKPPDEGSLSLHAGCRDDADFLKQICNGVDTKKDTASGERGLWTKRWDSYPNDYRDCLKYSTCARDSFFDDRKHRKFRIDRKRDEPIATTNARRDESPDTSRRGRERFRPRRTRRGNANND